MKNNREQQVETVEIDLLIEGIFRIYGWDFRDYSVSSMRRRINFLMQNEQLDSISALQAKILRDPLCMERLIRTMSINVTSMFRDPDCYLAFRKKVVPALRSYSFFRIWHAGCCTGEEVLSMAILLKEEGLENRYKIYATDMSKAVIDKAKAGVFPLEMMKEYTANYQKAGGIRAFSEYYTVSGGSALFDPALQKDIVWAEHNLATDSSFNEFQVIVCRNVMIYFNRILQNRVHQIFHESLSTGGILFIGKKESLGLTEFAGRYSHIAQKERIYRKS